MSSNVESVVGVLDRRDIYLDEAFQVVTEGALAAPNALQQALFPRLMTQDTGLLIPTGPCAGRFEAIVIPSLLGMRVDAAAHRLFIIGPDGCPLDDYAYRLATYVRALVVSDGVERTVWYEEPERTPIARKYLADGTHINGAADHPFSEDVDILVMPFSHLRALFFNSGGVHGVPEVIGFDQSVAQEMAPRGLFYFDESYGATREQQLEFRRMVEFLFAQDLDIVVGASSLPGSLEEELSFLEMLSIPETQQQPSRSLRYTPASSEEALETMTQIASDGFSANARVIVTLNDPHDERLTEAHDRLSKAYPNNSYLYRTSDSRAERGKVYAQLKKLDKEGEGYLLVVDGPALEVSDLDATHLISETCNPLSLVRRAGRCNRCGMRANGLLHLVGDASIAASADPAATSGRREAYVSSLEAAIGQPIPFDADSWKRLIG